MLRMFYSFFLFVGLLASCRCVSDEEYNTAVVSKEMHKSLIKEKMIKHVAAKRGYDRVGWIDTFKLNFSDMRSINIKLEKGKVICNKGNQLVNVSLLKEEFVSAKGSQAQFLLHLTYWELESDAVVLNPLPLIRENFVYDKKGKNLAFPSGFKGYIVCVESGQEAVLVPDHTDEVLFRDPSWSVFVDIEVVRNPLALFGRMYKITVLDNVDVLKNGKRSFLWPAPSASIVDAYAFHVAVEDSKKGKYCTLTRRSIDGDVVLRCDKWNIPLAPYLTNIHFGLGLGLANVVMASSDLMRPATVYYNVQHLKEKNSNKGKNRFIFTLPYNMSEIQMMLADKNDKNARKKKLNRFLIGNAIYLSAWVLANLFMQLAYYRSIVKNLKLMNENFMKAPFAFPWKLGTMEETDVAGYLK